MWNPPDPADLVPDIDSTNAPSPDDVPPAETQDEAVPADAFLDDTDRMLLNRWTPDAHLEAEYEDRFVFDADELPY